MKYSYACEPLAYSFDALEPYIDKKTLNIHFGKHYQGYIDNLNRVLQNAVDQQTMTLDQLLTHLRSLPVSLQTGVRNFGGGVYNHALFWQVMAPQGGGQPAGLLAERIEQTFGAFDAFQKQMSDTAKTLFGSGWAWLCTDEHGSLSIIQTHDQECPLTDGHYPLMCIDVWEHAYYLHYQNRRGDFVDAWWHVANWPFIQARYEEHVK